MKVEGRIGNAAFTARRDFGNVPPQDQIGLKVVQFDKPSWVYKPGNVN